MTFGPRPRAKLFFLIFFAILFTGKSFAQGVSKVDVLTDPGLVAGENVGCKYSTVDGLVYFCGIAIGRTGHYDLA